MERGKRKPNRSLLFSSFSFFFLALLGCLWNQPTRLRIHGICVIAYPCRTVVSRASRHLGGEPQIAIRRIGSSCARVRPRFKPDTRLPVFSPGTYRMSGSSRAAHQPPGVSENWVPSRHALVRRVTGTEPAAWISWLSTCLPTTNW